MTNVYCVRADGGTYTKHFLKGGYAGIGWIDDVDLSQITSDDALYPIYKKAHPADKSKLVIGQQVKQIARFLLVIKAGDYVLTPAADSEWLHYGKVAADPSYYYAASDDGCRYHHRRHVEWSKNRLSRSSLSVPLQNTLRSSLTVFEISQRDEIFEAIGRHDLVSTPAALAYDSYRAVLERILNLEAAEFEILITELLSALGFEGTKHTGKSGDGGVDAIGELNVANLAKVKLFVQVKRYQLDAKISASVVKQLRQSIPHLGQGAFITTADFQKKAGAVALEEGFPRIGLVNGR